MYCNGQGQIKGFWGLGLSGSHGPILSLSVKDLVKYVAYIPWYQYILNSKHIQKTNFLNLDKTPYFARTKLLKMSYHRAPIPVNMISICYFVNEFTISSPQAMQSLR